MRSNNLLRSDGITVDPSFMVTSVIWPPHNWSHLLIRSPHRSSHTT